jgi:hypothetical protein
LTVEEGHKINMHWLRQLSSRPGTFDPQQRISAIAAI